VIIHGKGIVLEREKISERRKLACNGSVFVSIKLSSNLSRIEKFSFDFLGLPTIICQNEDKFLKFLEGFCSQLNFKDLDKSKEELRIGIRRHLDQILGYKPTTTVHIL